MTYFEAVKGAAHEFRSRFEFGDALFLIYFVVIVRQWFWPLDNRAAWILTLPLGIACWCFYLLTKDPITARPRLSFWLIVGLPLLAAYALRAPFPDTSFDVWGLRLFHAERGLRGFLYLPGEFFPTAAPFNPTPDMVTGIFRHALGYRLGTIVNLFALLWTGTILDKLLRPIVAASSVRAVGVLLVLFSEHLLFEVNNYMPDLLALPVLLEALRLTLDARTATVKTSVLVRVAFLISVAVTLKLSNGAVAMPLVVIWLWRTLRVRPLSLKRVATAALLSLIVFALPLLPFSIWVYKLTGSPIFPLYNGVFRSPLYPPFNGWDNRWGGYGALEILGWPILMFLHPVRTAELPVYSGRLSAGFVLALLCLILARWLDQRTRTIAFLIVLGTLLWSVTMGYIRYGLYLELLSGMLLVALASILLRNVGRLRYGRLVLASLVCLLLVTQSVVAGIYLSRLEWSTRPTIFDDFAGYKRESRNILRDRSIRELLPQHERAMVDGVDVWVVSGIKTVGLMPLLNDRPKFVGVRAGGLFLAPGTREIFAKSLDGFRGQRMASIALPPDYRDSLFALRNVGLGVAHVEELVIPFFSVDDPVPVYFFKVTRNEAMRAPPTRTTSDSMLSGMAYQANIAVLNPNVTMKAGESKTLFLEVQNGSGAKWPSQGSENDKYQMVLRGRWLTNDTQQVSETSETTLPYDFLPGDSTILPLVLKTPSLPGEYLLELRMVQRGVVTPDDNGSNPLKLRLQID